MRHRLYICYCWLTVFLGSIVPGYAVKSVSTPLPFTRADGTRVLVRMYGDEFFSYKRDAEGYLVEVGKDGLLYYADYREGGLRLSKTRTTPVPDTFLAELRARSIQQKGGGRQQVYMRLPEHPSTRLRAAPLQVKTPVLLVEFGDVRFSIASPVARFSTQLNGSGYDLNGATGSAADYFNDNLKGRCIFTFEVQPVVIRLQKPQAYYGADGSSGVDARLNELFQDVRTEALKAGVDLSGYNWAGDGKIPYVALIYAGSSQAETGYPGDIWPQYQTVVNFSYQERSIQAFGCSSELSALGGLRGQMAGIGTFCHEFAHSLGLPDMYDTNGETEGKSPGLWGDFSLMDAGNYLNAGRTPPYFTAIEQEMIGHPVSIPEPGTGYELFPVWNGGEIIRIDSENPGEYFLVECRNPERWDAYIEGGGLMVYHVDRSEQVYGGISSAMRWQYNNVNTLQKHPCARIFSPTPENAGNLFFPGVAGNTQLSSYGKPRFADWNDKPLRIHLSGISYNKKAVRFNAVTGQIQDTGLPKAFAQHVFPYQYDCRITWSASEKEAVSGGKWRIRWRPVTDQKRTSVWEELFTSEKECYLFYLFPATEYEVSIVFEQESFFGEGVTFKCNTLPITSLMPYISGKGFYAVGEVLDLRLLNLTQEYEQVAWFVNGKEQKNLRLALQTAGVFAIRAEIQYKDGTNEFIVKNIKVN